MAKKTVKKNKAVEADYLLELAEGLIMEVYDRSTKRGKKYSVKLTALDALVVYGTIVFYKGKDGEEKGFLSLPSWTDKDGDRHSKAFIFNKDILADIDEFIKSELIGG